MKYVVFSVGKIRESFYVKGIDEYLKRLKAYTTIELIDGFEEKISPKASDKDIEITLTKEGQKLLNLINPNDLVILLDIQGKMLSSSELAKEIESHDFLGKSRVVFIIGSSYGVSQEVKKRADKFISFSPMTFPHQMAVLILAEQIYRSFKILRNEPYHK